MDAYDAQYQKQKLAVLKKVYMVGASIDNSKRLYIQETHL